MAGVTSFDSVETPPGWLVWNPKGDYPRVVHRSYVEAQQEARRLAEARPGHRYYVMASEGYFERALPEARWHPPFPEIRPGHVWFNGGRF